MLLNYLDLERLAQERQRALLAEAEAERQARGLRAARRLARQRPLDRSPRAERLAPAGRRPTGAA
ncbi:MAG TPA: hypothetical protein VFW96_14720 [Thermomicrobiales bacterium]|nr:hypothetical protein [Thermomicrobiales bacterium]